jgi:thioredoxin reductase (NADPH)
LHSQPDGGILGRHKVGDLNLKRADLINTDVVIIGAGPVGLFAIFQCGMAGLTCHVIDALDVVGGQCSALYPDKPIYDIPGFASISAQDLVLNLQQQAVPFAPVYHLSQSVTGLQPSEQGRWRLQTSRGQDFDAGAVIIAAGVGAFEPKRPPLAELETYENLGPGRGVNYLVNPLDAYTDKRIVIAGGGDSAVDWALALKDTARSVALVHRRASFRAHQASLDLLQKAAAAGQIELATPFQLAALQGENLQGVRIEDLDGNSRILEADVLLSFFGLVQKLGPINDWGLDIDNKRIVVEPTTAATNRPGIFAIGDIARYPHKQKLILTGFSEAAFAAQAAHRHIHPDDPLRFQHSTTKGLP